MLAEIGEGLGYVWREPVVRTLTAMIAVNSTFGFAYSVLLPAYAADVLKVGEKGYGFLNAAVGIGALAGALAEAALGRRKAKGLQITMGSLLFPLAVLAFAATRWLPLALVCLAAAGAGFVIQNATANTVIQMLVPDVLRARVMSVYSLCFFGTTPVGALLAGAAAERWGATAAVLLGSGVTLAFGLWVLARVPVVRRTRL